MHYRLFPVTEPVTDATVEKYKALRLASLKTDPSSFGSTYEREIALTPELWMKRLISPFKRTFIVSVKNEEESTDETWVGTVSILGPSELIPAALEPFERAGVGADWNMYVVVGMWVHPDHRGRGLAVRLMKEGLEWARTNIDPKNDSGEGRRDKMVLVQVMSDNASGCALYQKVGFTDLESMPPEELHRWMSLKVA